MPIFAAFPDMNEIHEQYEDSREGGTRKDTTRSLSMNLYHCPFRITRLQGIVFGITCGKSLVEGVKPFEKTFTIRPRKTITGASSTLITLLTGGSMLD